MPKPQQRTVRAGQLERVLGAKDAEYGQKVALFLEEYHTRWVVPLEQRIAYLEQPLYKRALDRIAAALARLIEGGLGRLMGRG